MKKLTFISGVFLSLLTFILTSCEKEKALGEAIIGKWEVQSVRQVNYENEVKVSEHIFYLKADEMAIQFAEGGTGIIYENGAIYGVFSWTLNGNTVSLSGSAEPIEWTVTVNDNVLVWSYTESEVIENVTHKYEYFYTAMKVS
ncbi:MAG: hypothetical protein MUO72_01460 [Bacteroidales bacterium]|nr:hypothetical protein [Bacteroidales bacterium]